MVYQIYEMYYENTKKNSGRVKPSSLACHEAFTTGKLK